LRVLIADDELNVSKLIKNLIDWETLDLEFVGFASNGNESYSMINEHIPEIVITDIRMPGKNGLEIIKECIEQGLNTQFIIISGHAEFDYAQLAVKYGVNDFLLKPVNGDELNASLKQIIARVSEAREEKQVITETLENSRTVLRNSLLLSLYQRNFNPDNHSIEALNANLCLNFKPGLFLPAVIKMNVTGKPSGHEKSILSQMRSIVKKELKPINYDLVVCDGADNGLYILCLFNYPESNSNDLQIALQYTFDLLLHTIAPYKLYQLVLGIGMPTQLTKQLQMSFSKAVCACESYLCLGWDRIINGENMDISLLNSTLISIEEPNRALKPYIELFDADNFCRVLRDEFRRQMPNLTLYPYSADVFIRKFVPAALRDILTVHTITDNQIINEQHILSNVLPCSSINEAENKLINCFAGFLSQLQEISPDHKAVVVVKSFIEQNYSMRLRLEDAADKVFLSPAYLGILFKQETGQNFSDYLIAVRIEKAKEMLKDIRYNINEIAKNVGYKDTRYFSKLFKNIEGINPSKYRQIFTRGGHSG